MTDDIRYPTGRFHRPDSLSPDERAAALEALDALPAELGEVTLDLSPVRLATPYRDGGWTVRQVVHHVLDSHVNAYVRIRRVLTEDTPTLVGYDQDGWAALADVTAVDIGYSLDALEGVHTRLVALLRSLDEGDFARRFVHADGYDGTLDTLVALYAWHGRHHRGHVLALREREGWPLDPRFRA